MVPEESPQTPRRVTELARFGVAGLMTEVVYFGLLWLCGLWSGLPLWGRATLAYLGSIIVNYSMQRTFTFRSNKAHVQAGPRYLAVHAMGMGINAGVLGISVDWLELPFLPCQIAAIGLVAICSYLGQKYWAF